MKFLTLAGVALRSLFLEASWNSRGQQNLGLAAAIDPALKLIHSPGDALKSARERALDFFNTNPVLSGLAIGVVLRLEEDVAAGRLSAMERSRLSASLNLALASIGDALFWQSWLPFCALAAVWAVLSLGQWWTPLILPGLFCLPALPVRLGGLYLGYGQGGQVIDFLARLKAQRLAQRIRRVMALLVGVSTVVLIPAHEHAFSLGGLWAALVLVTAGILLLRTAVRRARALHFWYPLFLVAVACVFLACLDILSGG
ncbi:MAG: PTS system mannose/fructose/sorbose family transporter subunit IID [Candidatus Adiutrix sp.]|jgi:PTS system mannose-specific IID component|nr:PTS system mannose/fructose/sorbose family transporter subunit IID [Candidatus Adiutrix sp.]